jgi:hypothetical protein
MAYVNGFVLYVLSALIGGSMFGALLGFVGSFLHTVPGRESAIVIVGLFVGIRELRGRHHGLPERARQTPPGLSDRTVATWATASGALIGIGAATTIGYSIWYLTALGVLYIGEPSSGAWIFGTYAAVRTVSALPMAAAIARRGVWAVGTAIGAKGRAARVLSGIAALLTSSLWTLHLFVNATLRSV